MNHLTTKVTKHRSTITPFECAHCGLIWYGWTSDHREAPGVTLCSRCWNGLDTYLWNKYDDVFSLRRNEGTDEKLQEIRNDAQSWIENKSNKPLPRPEARRFHASVPHWMRIAINAGKVKTNDNRVFTVFSQGTAIVRVEIASSYEEAKERANNIKKARRLIRECSKSTRSNHFNKGWLGVAPSYLCTELEIEYDEAATILKDLEEEGFIYDNGHGNHNILPDGRTYATRYYMTVGAESK